MEKKCQLIHIPTNEPEEWYKHLYILSDDKIEEGDTYINEESKLLLHRNKLLPKGKKVIATTDKLEIGQEFTSVVNEANGVYRAIYLASIPQSFIEEYCKNPVDEVMVEYEEICPHYNGEHIGKDCSCKSGFILRPKLTDNNEVIVSHVEEKMYTREELIYHIDKYREWSNKKSNSSASSLVQWIKENL